MSKCPKCGTEIESLNFWETGESKSVFDGGNYEIESFEADGQTTDYECPECGEILFTDEDGAKKFLEKKEER